MGSRAIGIGLAGVGGIGHVHAANLAAGVPGARLARVADSSASALRRIGQLYEVPSSRFYGDLLDDPRVDAVVIATPPATHPEMVQLATAAGKHVFCEKPLALDIESAEAGLSAAKRAGVVLQVGFHRRFDADYMLAKSLIARGELGRIYGFFDSMRDMEPPLSAEMSGAQQALLHDAACHDLDAARWLVGEVDEITTFGANLASEPLRAVGQVDHAITVLRFENGSLGTIDNTLASGYGFDCKCEIVGSEGTVRIDNPYLSNVELLTRRTSGFERTRTFLDRFEHAYPRELESFVDAVHRRAEVAVSGEDGLAAVVLATAAQRSLETNRSVRLRRRLCEGQVRYAMDEQ
jgi:myo-inositol 2-dehydrogenase/D-chiro-inositol 1-dehydrogenase